jgi:hypothetical protein
LRSCVAGEHAVGNGDAQHRPVTLDVEAILQAKRAQLVGRQVAGQMARDLTSILRDALIDDLLVNACRSDTWLAPFYE